MIKVAASVLAADVMHMSREIHSLEDAGCDWVHIDIMDGLFVPNYSFGPALVSAMKKKTTMPLDVHLMVVAPERYISCFIKAGADFLTVHYETVAELGKTLAQIREAGVGVGVSIRPGTDVHVLAPYFEDIDMALIMTVEPGFGGQKFNEGMIDKIKTLREMGYGGLIEVDGGVNEENIAVLRSAGVDVAVMGTALFCAKDKHELLATIHNLL